MHSLHHADIRLEIDEAQGGRATSWKVGEHELLGAKRSHDIEHGMYPMAPWAGRIAGNAVTRHGRSHSFPVNFAPWAIHGLVLHESMDVIEHASDHLVLESEFGSSWPWGGGVRCAWTLDDAGLTTELTCYSHAEEFPAVVGWHPWFRREIAGVQGTWATDCTELLTRGDDSLPTGERRALQRGDGPYDDVLTQGTHASIEWSGLLRVGIENSHPWFVVFDELQDFICIEPQTGPADGLTGRHAPLVLVTPDQPLVMRTRWRITREPQATRG